MPASYTHVQLCNTCIIGPASYIYMYVILACTVHGSFAGGLHTTNHNGSSSFNHILVGQPQHLLYEHALSPIISNCGIMVGKYAAMLSVCCDCAKYIGICFSLIVGWNVFIHWREAMLRKCLFTALSWDGTRSWLSRVLVKNILNVWDNPKCLALAITRSTN